MFQPEHRSYLGPASGLEQQQTDRLLDPAKNLVNPVSGTDRLAGAKALLRHLQDRQLIEIAGTGFDNCRGGKAPTAT